MPQEVRRYCSVCGDLIFKGEVVEYPHGPDIYEDDYGDYFDGAGECVMCERELCEYCGEFEDGVCRDCREKEED